ncbi:MAG TPA: hypothetical protein VKV73_20385 [Chloroflexota bacterium]|nr:hypothetical protein [Chloroflexota bacterium]
MIQIDADDGAVRVELPHGEAATIEGLQPGTPVERGTQRALFLDPDEADTLGKMIDYILGQIAKGQLKIQPTSQERLEAVRPRMVGLFDERVRT